jgi:Meiotically Up-regulated Gene 113 (MUG113) protein
MPGSQPNGLREFVRVRGYYSLYFLRAQLSEPIKVGITHDPVRRLSALQNANWRPVSFDRLWWLPGQPIAARIEAVLKLQFLPQHVRGEWYEIDPAEAGQDVEETIERLGTWGIT